MQKLTFTFLCLMAFWSALSAQYATINYDLERNYFNEGQPLPADQPIMFTGLVPSGVDIIEISVFPGKTDGELKDRLFVASWKDFDNQNNTNFSVAVNYRLRSSEKYDFRVEFYEKISKTEQSELKDLVMNRVTDYLEANIKVKKKGFSIYSKKKRMVSDLEAIIQDALKNYRNRRSSDFEGLSETVYQKLEKLEDIKADKDSLKNEKMLNEQVDKIQKAVLNDIQSWLNTSWSKLVISRYVDDFETEKKRRFFSLSAGYGGIYFDGQLDDLSYGSAPYAGFVFPLSRRASASRFLQSSSFTIGVFLQDFEDDNGNEIKGLIIDTPLYAGLGYRLFEFVHLNAGATILERTEMTRDGNMTQTNQVTLIRPFVGLSARIDLSISLGR